eukprot:COSAG01_NODE_3838_length_5647_cov_14.881399_2_plen_91_part_00
MRLRRGVPAEWIVLRKLSGAEQGALLVRECGARVAELLSGVHGGGGGGGPSYPAVDLVLPLLQQLRPPPLRKLARQVGSRAAPAPLPTFP